MRIKSEYRLVPLSIFVEDIVRQHFNSMDEEVSANGTK